MKARVVAAASALLALAGCGAPIEGEVTFKIIERPYVENVCNPAGVTIDCGDVVIPTTYRVEIQAERNAAGYEGQTLECWKEVDPHDYSLIEVGDKVTLGDPEWSSCDVLDWNGGPE